MISEAASLGVGYLLGSVPASLWIARIRGGIDLRERGSGNAGATNVLRVLGWRPGLVALALDAGKGVAAVAIARSLLAGASPGAIEALAAGGAVVGHVWPVFAGFRGGRGVATSAGSLGVLCAPALAAALAVFGLGAALTRRVSLASLLAAASVPLALWLLDTRAGLAVSPPVYLFGLALPPFLAFTHWDNVVRLLRGEEPPIR